MRIGILKCGQSPDILRGELGDYDTMFENLLANRGFSFDSYHVEALEFPQDISAADGWLLTGSKHGVYEDHAFIPPLTQFIQKAYSEDVPMVGICFGHQIIAQALGGKVVKYDGGWAIGQQEYDLDGQRIILNAWHQDQVVRRPDAARSLGSNDFCENAILAYDDRAFTVQAHPEFDDRFVQGLIDHRGKGVVPDQLLDQAQSRMGANVQQSLLADRIETFFKTKHTARTKGAA